MSATAFDRVLDALTTNGRRVEMAGEGSAKAQCPAHDDHSPSLSITRKPDRVLVSCHAGCDTDEVLDAIGMSRADLFDSPLQNGNGQRPPIVAAYDYRDEAEVLLYQNVRYVPKDFRVRRPDGHGGWIWNLKGVRNVLLHLPQVISAVADGKVIHLVEGEKDVLALESIGAVATTAVAGAKSFHKVDATPLHGANVVAVVDNDDNNAGRDEWAPRVRKKLDGHAASLTFVRAAEGKDAADHIAAGHGVDDFQPIDIGRPAPNLADPPPDDDTEPPDDDEGTRHIVLTPASEIRPRPVYWLWKNRLALGTIGLLAGREGTGKSILSYWMTARLTRGELFGHFDGQPRAVLVCATEDSWEHTIVPRLIAAGANLAMVFRVEVLSALDIHVGLSLPRDLIALERVAKETRAVLLLLDPLMSRLGDLDTHRDAEVRLALEPLMAIADRTQMAILGLIHHNKSGSTDPLQLVMGSKAFTAVARSVHTVVPDPDDETDARRLFGTPKNNLGRNNLPTFSFTIVGHAIDTDEGVTWTGRLEWGAEHDGNISDVMAGAADSKEDRTAIGEAAGWLSDYVASKGGQVSSSDAKKAGRAVGHSERTLQRAVRRTGLKVSATGFPRVTYWETPDLFVPPEDPNLARGHTHAGAIGATDPRGEISLSSISLSEHENADGSTVTPDAPDAPRLGDPTRAGATAVWEQTDLGHRGKT